jgi:hypothetical protein
MRLTSAGQYQLTEIRALGFALTFSVARWRCIDIARNSVYSRIHTERRYGTLLHSTDLMRYWIKSKKLKHLSFYQLHTK